MPSTREFLPKLTHTCRTRVLAAVLACGAVLAGAACDEMNNGVGTGADDGATPAFTTTAPANVPDEPDQPEGSGANIPAPEPGNEDGDLTAQFLRAALRIAPGETPEGVSAHVLPLEGLGADLWLAVTSGPGVVEILGERAQMAAVYERLEDGQWAELVLRRLESTPTVTRVELVEAAGTGASAWAAVFGEITGAGTTFELLRYDGEALTSALWWYSASGEAAQLIDLDGDGRPELVLDASDPTVLCAGCGVVDVQEVIYRWDNGFIQAVEFAPLERGSDVASVVAEGIAQVRAGLWRAGASSFAEATLMAPDDANVRWMAHLAERIAEGRLAHAGSEVQPLLTQVLAGEYEAAVNLMRPLGPEQAFAAAGPLIAGTAAEGHEREMGALLIEHSSRALEYEPDLGDAYAVRALGRLLEDTGAHADALGDLEQALAVSPADEFYARSVTWLQSQLPDAAPPSPPTPAEPTPAATPEPTPTAEPTASE